MSTVAQRSFAGGEISPSLYARVDVVKYATGLRTCRNFYIKKSGGASNRAGTEFMAEGKYPGKEIRLIPFIFNASQTYTMEFGDFYIRFIRDGAQIVVSGVAAYSGATAYVIGNLVLSGGINYYCVANTTGNAPPNATYWYALTGSIFEIPSPYAEADLADLHFVQSADVVTVTHQTYAVRELARTGHTAWTLSLVTFAPSISAPTGVAVSGGAGTTDQWVVTAIAPESFEESLQSSAVGASSLASSGSPRTISWTAQASAFEFNIYKNSNGVYGFIGVAQGTSFVDDGIPADTTDTPPQARNPFPSAGNFPATCGYYQQRLGFANTVNKPDTAYFSKSANFKNFTTSAPLQDDDSVTMRIPGRRVNAIQSIIDLGSLITLSSDGEWLVQGDTAGIIRPGEVNPKQQSYNGANNKRPLLINDNALYIQARGTLIRDLFSNIDATGNIGYKGTDLTVFANHLFKGHTILDWDYAQTPDSIVWVVRSDGVLLGLTYLREHSIWAWHRHDTDGEFENVCVVPEDNEDVAYFTVKRVIDGTTTRYIERMATRVISDIVDYIGMDSAITYDGRNTGATTMTLSGSGWTYHDTLTLTASASFFTAGDVGNQIWMYTTDGDVVRCTIIAFTSVTVVSVKPNKTVPVSLQAVAITNWAKAVDQVTGLDHLEDKEVSVLANGLVIANPYNDTYPVYTVTAGSITFDKPYSVMRIGLPFISDLSTLDIDSGNTETIADKKKLINRVTLFVEESRGIWVGSAPPTDDDDDALEGLEEYKARNNEGYDFPIDLIPSDQIEINIRPEWNSNGRVFIRQVDPLPLTVLAVMPAGLIPFRGGV